jgi:hypothetical protein
MFNQAATSAFEEKWGGIKGQCIGLPAAEDGVPDFKCVAAVHRT